MGDDDALVNRFKQRLVAGETQYGLFCGLADTVAIELVAGAGFDWLLLDMEHTPVEVREVMRQAQVAAAYPVAVLARPPIGEPAVIKRLLDAGVQSLVVPMVESAEQAKRLVAAMRYPPAGVRGVGGSLARATRWNRVPGYSAVASDVVCLVCQIESIAGVEQAAAIAAVEGVDALFVGPSDLAASMGHVGDAGHPDVQAAVGTTIAACRAAGTPVGVFTTGVDAAHKWVAAGATFVAVGADIALLSRAAIDLATALRTDGE